MGQKQSVVVPLHQAIRQQSSASQSIGLRVIRGALVPATEVDALALRSLNLRTNMVVSADIDWMRAPHDLRRIHRLGQILVDQVPDFAHLDAHEAIKRLQAASGAGCRVIGVPASILARLAGLPCPEYPDEIIPVNEPYSLSPSTLSGAQFARLLDQLCKYVALHIWPELSDEEIVRWTDEIPYSTP